MEPIIYRVNEWLHIIDCGNEKETKVAVNNIKILSEYKKEHYNFNIKNKQIHFIKLISLKSLVNLIWFNIIYRLLPNKQWLYKKKSIQFKETFIW